MGIGWGELSQINSKLLCFVQMILAIKQFMMQSLIADGILTMCFNNICDIRFVNISNIYIYIVTYDNNVYDYK